MKYFLLMLLLDILISQCRNTEVNYITQFPGKPEVPVTIQQEHTYLLGQIHQMTSFQDTTGRIALKMEELMQHHFKEEEDYVLPPLGLLPLLASSQMPESSKDVIQLTMKLKSQTTQLNLEHQMISAYMAELKQAAAADHHPGISEFENKLDRHAKTEEEIFFPAAILVGEYLKTKTE